MSNQLLNLSNAISNYFQNFFEIQCKNKIIKKGKLLLLNNKDFCINLNYTDLKNNKIRNYSIPLPFNYVIDSSKNIIYLYYTLDNFIKNNYDIELCINTLNKSSHQHIFYNEPVTIKFYKNLI